VRLLAVDDDRSSLRSSQPGIDKMNRIYQTLSGPCFLGLPPELGFGEPTEEKGKGATMKSVLFPVSPLGAQNRLAGSKSGLMRWLAQGGRKSPAHGRPNHGLCLPACYAWLRFVTVHVTVETSIKPNVYAGCYGVTVSSPWMAPPLPNGPPSARSEGANQAKGSPIRATGQQEKTLSAPRHASLDFKFQI
jgi:hypothetical protein